MKPREPQPARVLFIWLGAVVLVAASISLAIREEYTHRAVALQQAEAQTDVLAGSVSAALDFDDEGAMRQYLSALMRNPEVAAAGIYGPHGAQVTVLTRKNADPMPTNLIGAGTQRIDGRIIVARPVAEQGQRLGTVYLQTAPESLSEVVARHTGLVILTLLALLLLSFVTRAAARLVRANTRLSEEIEARAAVEEALRQSQKLEALGQLTGGIAHDFNNLLQAIHGAFELILGKSGDEKTVRRWAQNGLDAADRGASLTRQLLAFSRQQRLEMKPLIVADTLERMADLLIRSIGPEVRLVFDLDRDRIPVMSDVTQLELAVMNLAVNARDAMPGGGTLIIRTQGVMLQGDAVLPPGRYLQVQVIDTGEGMPLHVVHRAFDPFFTTKALGKGTGLGLAQVYGVARQAGGDARIASTPGGGTTVTLLLREDGAAMASEPADVGPRPVGARGSATVLLVDDDEAVRRVVRGGLEMRGFKVLDANGGEAALELAAGEAPQIAVIDYAMPDMDGAKTAERLRQMLPNLPIILASGHADTAAVERVLGGAATVMRKPFDIDDLSQAVARMLAEA
jgi:signal transduction histidine kinase